MKNLKDHIDEPILKAVAGLNLLGFKTNMSCCGFSYKGEKVKKSHLGKSYIYLTTAQIRNSATLKTLLCDLCLDSKWLFRNNEPFVDFYAAGWQNGETWASRDSVHNYEMFVLNIKSLLDAIKSRENLMMDSVKVIDGYHFYKEKVSSYWQYEPAEDWHLTKEEYLTIPS